MTSSRLWASSIMTTFPFSLSPRASLVSACSRVLYGSTTSLEGVRGGVGGEGGKKGRKGKKIEMTEGVRVT